MNERIKELIDECTYIVTDYTMGMDCSEEKFNKEKFAELIIRECAAAIKVEQDTGLYNAHQLAGMSVSKAVIKDHFGVE